MTGALPPLRLVLVDDHRLFRESLGALLAVHEGIEVVAEGANGEEARPAGPRSTAPTSSCSTWRCPASRC